MEEFIRIVNVVLPVILIIVFGYAGKKLGFLSEEFVKYSNPIVYRVFMPVNIFNIIHDATGFQNLDMSVVVLVFAIITGIVIFSNILFTKLEYPNDTKAVTINGLFRSNIVLFGLAISHNYFPSEELAIIILYIVLISVLRDVYSVLTYEFMLSRGGLSPIDLIRSVFRSPIFLASIIGIGFSFTGLELPLFLEKTIGDISKVTAPLGLMCVGATIELGDDNGDGAIIKIATVLKSVIIPAIALGLGYILGYTGPELFVLIILFATPIAVSSYAMAARYTDKENLAAKLVAYSTVTNGFTVFIAIYVLSRLGAI